MFKQTQIRERLDRTGVPLNCLVAFCTFLLCFQMFSAFRPCFVAPIWILRQVLTMLQSGGKNRGKSVCDRSSAPWNILQSTETCIYLKPIFKLFQRHVCVFIASLRISAYDTMWKITCKCILCQSTALYLHWDLWDDWDWGPDLRHVVSEGQLGLLARVVVRNMLNMDERRGFKRW